MVLEDKIVQRAVTEVLNAIYEGDFLGFSYGFRPRRSAHQALDILTAGLMTRKVNWVLDADILNFFGTLEWGWLLTCIERRIGDRRIVRLIQKWLKAGVLEKGKWTASEVGTVQGGSISPLLANIYLHYVFDLWVHHWRKTQAGGDVIDEKTNKAVFNSPAGVKAIEYYVDLINVHKVAVPGVLSNGEREKRGSFGAGNIAMMFEGPWGIAIQQQMNPNLKFDIALLPKGVTTGTVVRGQINAITTQAQNKEAAWKLMRWLSGPVGNEFWARGTGDFPGRKDVAAKPFFQENKLVRAIVEQMLLPNAKSPNLGMPNAVQLNKVLTSEIQNVVQGKKSAKQALDDAAAEWNKVLAKYQQ